MYTDTEFDRDCLRLAAKIPELGPSSALVALKAIRDGGLILARELESLLEGTRGTKIDVFDVNYLIQEEMGQIRVKSAGAIHDGLFRRQIYLITEICNSGRIVQKAVRDLKKRHNTVTIVALHCRIGSHVRPDICLHRVREDVSYPWERHD
jgi:pyrimidine operon attenuation protein/uracil phosphoribosyltransferase